MCFALCATTLGNFTLLILATWIHLSSLHYHKVPKAPLLGAQLGRTPKDKPQYSRKNDASRSKCTKSLLNRLRPPTTYLPSFSLVALVTMTIAPPPPFELSIVLSGLSVVSSVKLRKKRHRLRLLPHRPIRPDPRRKDSDDDDFDRRTRRSRATQRLR